jgi:Ca2+-binding RTX toxin-like protein
MSTVTGTAGNDTLHGNPAGHDTILGLDGNDSIVGAPFDYIDGGPGDDTVSYANATSGVGVFLSGGGNPYGDALGDTFVSIENVIGSSFDDVIYGNGTGNKLYGGDGDDTLFGFGSLNGPVSFLYGGNGDDTLLGSAGHDYLDGGTGENTVSYLLAGSISGHAVTVNLADSTQNTGDAAGDTFVNIQDVIGTDFNDIIYGDNLAHLNQLQGQAGNDTIYGNTNPNGYTVLIGGSGADELHGGAGGNEVDYETAQSGVTASLANSSINTGDAAGDSYIGLFGMSLAGSTFGDVLYGDAGDNVILGDPDRSKYGGHFGNDTIYGGAGNDILVGGGGADYLDGGSGTDAAAYTDALAGVHADMLNPNSNTGDAAGDTYVSIENLMGSSFNDFLGGDNSDNTIFGAVGNDTLYGYGGNDTLDGGAGADLLDGGAGYNYASYLTSTSGLTADLADNTQNTGDAAGDTYVNIQGVAGTNYDDTLVGNDLGDSLLGGAGNDKLLGGAGDDFLAGGTGNDSLYGGNGNDTLDGGSGADFMDGGAGENTAYYGAAATGVTVNLVTGGTLGDAQGDTYVNVQNIRGSAFDDSLTGDANANQIFGGAGNDTIHGGDGNDILDGGSGSDFIDGGNGIDILSFASSTAGVVMSLASGGTGGDAAGDTYVSIETVIGTSFDDTIGGDANANTLFGGAGNDVLNGGGGGDTLEGGAGSDTLNGMAGSYDYASYGTAAAGVTANLLDATKNTGDAAGDVYNNISGILGSSFNDVIVANNSGNTLQGGAGNDTLIGGAGNDFLVGGDGNDTIIATGGGVDQFNGGAGSDTFVFTGRNDSFSDPTLRPASIIQDFQTGIDKIDLSAMSPLSYAINFDSVSNLYVLTALTSQGVFTLDSKLALTGSDLILSATGQNLVGTAVADTLVGGAGNDVLTGFGGADILTGGAGNDTFVYTSASDSTQAAPDFITDFTTGSDKIDLSGVTVNHISTIVNGAADFVFVETSSGALMQINVAGTVQAADFSGVPTNYYMQGDGGDNTIVGGAGNDVIDGHGGNDLIVGGGSSDALFGGTGADTFKYMAISDSLQGSGADTIFDFASGTDKIDLSAISINHISTIDNGTAEFVFIETTSGTLMQINFVGVDVAKPGDFNVTGGTNYYIQGDEGNNTLIGGNGKDVIDGHGGNDVIIGGGNTDALFGGAGSDTFKYLAASDSTPGAPDTIFDFASGTDKIDLTAVHTSSKDVFNILVSGGASYIFVDLGGDGVNDMLIQATGTVTASDILWNKTSDAVASPAVVQITAIPAGETDLLNGNADHSMPWILHSLEPHTHDASSYAFIS